MDAQFWHNKWRDQDIGFHQPQGNPLLAAHFNALALAPGSRIFVPLCGKTRDIAWLLAQGFAVVGAELSELAVEQLFAELNVQPRRAVFGNCVLYQAQGMDIFVGDIFALTHVMVGKIDAIYDRAALVALPEQTRKFYTAHLIDISSRAKQLVITFEYDQNQLSGPPFSIASAQMEVHYKQYYNLQRLSSVPVEGGLKSLLEAQEVVWLLSR